MSRWVYESDSAVPAGLLERLERLGRVQTEPEVRLERTWFDTFDWRLFRQGQVLEFDRIGGNAQANWRRRVDGHLEASFPEVPRFARELRPGPLRERLEATITVRALLPVTAVKGQQTRFLIQNEDRKTIARVESESLRLGSDGPLHRLTVHTLPGYDRPGLRLRKLVEGDLQLPAAERDLFEVAVGASGRQPGDYTSRLKVSLDPTMTSGAAARRILGLLLEKVLVNLDGTREDIDIEFLHDLRTAVRRARSALGQFKQVLHPGLMQRLGQELRWVGQLTTPMRDLDVHLVDFEQVWPSYEPELYAALQPVGTLLNETRVDARTALVRGLDGRRFAGVLDLWRSLLNQADPPRTIAPKAEQPVCWLAARRIARLHRRMRAAGSAIRPETPDEAVHDLRKLGKKFRYTIEMFQSLYAAKQVKPALGGLKGLQDCLGRFNDLSVQQDVFRGWASVFSAQSGRGATLLAMGQLVERLRSEQHQVRRDFQEQFAAFDAPAVRKRLQALGRAPKLS